MKAPVVRPPQPMLRLIATVILPLLALVPAELEAQARVFVRDAGPGRVGRMVAAALTRPHVVITGDSSDVVLQRDSTVRQSMIVIGRDVRLASAVEGDVVVIGGDVYLRPGVRVEGDVIAAGGGIYNTLLGTVAGERHAFRDETLLATLLADGSYALDYQALRVREFASFTTPGLYGFGLPQYDRVNGLALPWAPFVQLDSGRISLQPTLTYRTHLGKLDPSVVGTMMMGRRSRVEAFAGRTTRTNDAWISGNLANSLSSIWSGRDTRNWYRADLVEGAFHRMYEGRTSTITPYVGAQWERAWTTGIQDPARHLAYSVLGRRDTVEGMARPNPAVDAGQTFAALAGFEGEWESPPQEIVVTGNGRLEIAPRSAAERRFSQLTLDGRIAFPLTRTVKFRQEWHGVATVGRAPRQRYAYLGGSGTLKTVDLLSMGGDQLLFVDSRASMPLEQFRLPFVGPPTVTVRHAMGAAGVGRLPGLTHNIGLAVSVMLLRAEYVIDPVSGRTDFSVAVSFAR